MKKLIAKFIILALISWLLGKSATEKMEPRKAKYENANYTEVHYEL